MPDRKLRQNAADALSKLSDWGSSLAWADVPEDVRRRAALILLDDFGAMVAASNEPELNRMRESIAPAAGIAEATIFDGGRRRMDRYSAALLNGTAADWCELDSGYRPAVCHAGLYCFPALLAEAEATEFTLRDVLLAFIVGYETVTRVARCFRFPDLVLHPHAGFSTIGAAASIAKLRGLTGPETAKALCTSATLVLPGPFNHAVEGALVRNTWPGICAQNGIRAVDWSSLGVSATSQAFSDVFVDIFGARAKPSELSAKLGESWSVRDGYHKLHACCQFGHSVVESILNALGHNNEVPAEAVEKVIVETHSKARKLDNPAPKTTLAAKFSIQHIAATTIAFRHANASAFSTSTLEEPALSSLRRKVEILAFKPELGPPNDRASRVSISLRDGGVLEGECLSARGGTDNPLTENEITYKAANNLRDAYPKAYTTLRKMISLNPSFLARSWSEIVSEFRC